MDTIPELLAEAEEFIAGLVAESHAAMPEVVELLTRIGAARDAANPVKDALADASPGTFGPWRLAPGIDAHYIMQGDHCIASCDEHDDAEAIMVLARAAGLA